MLLLCLQTTPPLPGHPTNLGEEGRREEEGRRGGGEGENDTDGSQPIVLVLLYTADLDYSGTSDKGHSEIGTTSLQRTLVSTPC